MSSIREPKIFAYLAEFDEAEKIIEAAQRARDAGFEKMQAYTPFSVEELSEILQTRHRNWIPTIVLFGAIFGGVCGFFLQYYAAAISYPLNIGGRPLNSWEVFIPITFELTILGGAITGALGLFILCSLPQLYHPVFTAPEFRRASQNAFFLSIEAKDKNFDETETREFLESLDAVDVTGIFDKRTGSER